MQSENQEGMHAMFPYIFSSERSDPMLTVFVAERGTLRRREQWR